MNGGHIMRQPSVRLASGLLAGIVLACGVKEVNTGPSGPPLAANQVLATNATVRFVNLEGGCWALETPRGKYEPLGLPSAFRIDGLAVYAVVRGAPTAVSICQMAPLVTLDSIRTR